MVDVNEMVANILSQLKKDGVRVCYQYPEEFAKLPAVSHYELFDSEGFRADNAEWSQKSRVQIDIWAEKKTEPARIAALVNALMQGAGWLREFSRDMPKLTEQHLYHKTMRFAKEIYAEGGDDFGGQV